MLTLFEQMQAFGPPEDQTIGGLCDAHQQLANELSQFTLDSSIRLIAALETIPSLLEYTIRLEVLIAIAVSRCRGSKPATVVDLQQWISLMEASPMVRLEDPIEDVFIGYVCTDHGGFRVYQGIFSNADFNLERLLNFMAKKTKAPGFGTAYESVIELLKVSEAIAEVLSQGRYLTGKSVEVDGVSIPAETSLSAHSSAVVFGADKVNQLGLDQAKLAPFMLTQEKKKALDSKELFGSPVELNPLIPVEGGFVVASPTSICRAAIVHLVDAASRFGGFADDFFAVESATFFLNEILKRLDIKPIEGFKLPKPPSSLPPLFPVVGQFDYGMPVISFTKSSKLTAGSNLEEMESLNHQQTIDFNDYITQCCKTCEEVEGFRGGLVLLAFSTFGKAAAIAAKEPRPKWQLFTAALGDWQTLASDQDFNAKRLWYLGLQEKLAESSNLEILNPSGLLNLYGFWKDNDFSLIHHSVNPKNPNNIITIDGSYSLRTNSELRSIRDRHCRQTMDDCKWITLERLGRGLNPNQMSNLMYVDHTSANSGLLRGCVEFKDSAWWIQTKERPKNSKSLDLVFRLWDCVFNWVECILPKIYKNIAEHRDKQIVIELTLENIDEWNIAEITRLPEDQNGLSMCADTAKARIQLTLNEGFLRKFHRPDNYAEREIVKAILKGAFDIYQQEVTDHEQELVANQITKNQNTRFFHVVVAPSLESALGSSEHAAPNFIPFEEITRARIGLAYSVEVSPPQKIADPTEAKNFLNKAVASLQSDVCARLKQLDILPVVSLSFSQLDDLSRDSTRWSLSTRSLQALSDAAPWLQERLRTESGRHALAEITNRVLIETAVYSYEPNAEECISQTEHATLLAKLAVMIELANHRDAIVGSFVNADLTIHPNGMIDFDESFQQRVFQPYLTSRIDDRIKLDAEAYDSHFFNYDSSEDTPREQNPEVESFKRAFQDEFGFSFDKVHEIIDYFAELALKQQRSGGIIRSITLRRVLVDRIRLTDAQIETIMQRFVLPIRSKWDSNLPSGCQISDVLPWRFFRGLSVLLRPFVEVSRSPRVFAVSAPHLARWRHYMANAIAEGHLPDKLFSSPGMSKYLGNIANKKGHNFTKTVSECLSPLLPIQRLEIQMTELGAPAIPDLGDVDILAWETNLKIVFVIECKRLKSALTVRQVIQQLEEFRGNQKEKDSLAKHQRRVAWLKVNPTKVSEIAGIPADEIKWAALLVTKGRVPMSYLDAFECPKEQVVPIKELSEHIASHLNLAMANH